MSLAITAAPWRNDTSSGSANTRRRVPSYTARRTMKQTRAYPQQDDYNISPSNDDKLGMMSDVEIYNETGLYPVDIGGGGGAAATVSNNGVNAISNMMKKLDAFDGENSLADFNPPPMPQINQRIIRNTTATPSSSMESFSAGGADEDDDKIPIYVPAPPTSQIAGAGNLGMYANYTKNYEPPRGLVMGGGNMAYPTSGKRYNSNGGGGGGKHHTELIEKLNYIIHMLEMQTHEKTDNVMEELILYSFLGIFIIFLCDCFARAN